MSDAAPIPSVTLLCGPAGVGKTTIARALEASGAVVLSFDREAWARGVRGVATREVMLAVDADLAARLEREVAAGRDVVVDASLATREVRDEWRERVARAGGRHELVVVRAPLAVLLDRVAARTPGAESVVVDPEALRASALGFDWPGDDEPHRLVDTG